MSKITKNISRFFIISSFLVTVRTILSACFFALGMAIPGHSESGLFEQALLIVTLVGGTLIVLMAFLHRFLWRIKIHKD
jgi:hypothetical protein